MELHHRDGIIDQYRILQEWMQNFIVPHDEGYCYVDLQGGAYSSSSATLAVLMHPHPSPTTAI